MSVDSTGLLSAERLRTRRMTKVEVAEDDPQRREAWFSAAETLRKAATVGVSGAQVDAFGKPIGFSKEVHNALRAKKIYNRAPKNKTQYDTLTKTKWTPYTERVTDRRHRWHRTQSKVDLGESSIYKIW